MSQPVWSQPLLWLIGLLGVALLSLGCLFLHAPAIEADLNAGASGALNGVGYEVSGRTLTLTGTVPTDAARLAAVASARGVPGVARVVDRLNVLGGADAGTADADLGAFSLMASGASGPIVVRGAVGSEAEREALLARIAAAFPGREITDALTVSAGASMDWDPSLAALLPLLGDVNAPSLTIEGGEIVVRGTVADEATRARIEAALQTAVVAPYTLRSELTVGAPEASGDEASDAANQVESSGSTDAEVVGAEEALREALSIGQVEFESGTSTLTPQSREILDAAATVFTRFPSVGAEVQGHTDSQGADATNQALSQTRAEAVRDYLVGQGVDAAQLTPRGYGEAEPIADNDTAEGRARNRRVVFSLRSL